MSQPIQISKFRSEIVDAYCPKHGIDFKQERTFYDGELKHEFFCPECRKEFDAQQNRKKEAEKIDALKAYVPEYVQRSVDEIGTPKRYKSASLDSYQVSNKGQAKAHKFCSAYVESFEKCFESGTSMIFCGNVGTGKTHLAYAVARAVVEQYQVKLYPLKPVDSSSSNNWKQYESHASISKVTNLLDILRNVKATYNASSEMTEREVIETYADYDLLVIDEVSVNYGTEADKIILFDILNRRYQAMKPTIFISNLSLPELTEFVGERVIDRMKENNGAVINFDWQSERGVT